ncbi:Gfo/Idh/MocA family protein [Nocardioides sp. LHG3406-4]|uniref:Gfo/Idh/MocA family protein n=1 Tax=Nocardioides sp. LHG3406-4 TaxID=2804575 RepID=UPI003CEC6FE6
MTTALAIAGLGAAGLHLYKAVLRHPEVELVAVMDVDPAILDVLRGRVPILTRDFEELCTSARVQAIFIGSPTPLHLPQALAALDHDKDVIVEKPMSTDYESAVQLREHARRTGRVLVVGHSQSFEPFVRCIAESRQRHDLGGLRRLVLSEQTDWMTRPRTPEELDESLGGGPILRQGAHLVDTARYLAGGGPVTDVTASGFAMDGAACHGSFVASMRAGGALVTLAYDGYGPNVGDGQSLSPLSGEEAASRKGHLNATQLAQATDESAGPTAGGGSPPAWVMQRAVLAVYERGQVSYDSTSGLVRTVRHDRRAHVEDPRLLSSGRTALLDELIAAREGTEPLHDGTWGAENLRVCLEMAAAARDEGHGAGRATSHQSTNSMREWR